MTEVTGGYNSDRTVLASAAEEDNEILLRDSR